MPLKVIDGLRSQAHANSDLDLNVQPIVAGNTVNGAVHTIDGFGEFLALFTVDDVDTGATLIVKVQESNEAAANFTNISGATKTIAAGSADIIEMISVDWKHPDRKKYARVTAQVTGANNADLSAVGLKMVPFGGAAGLDLDTGDNVVEVTA